MSEDGAKWLVFQDEIEQLKLRLAEANARADRAETVLYGQPWAGVMQDRREAKEREERVREAERAAKVAAKAKP